MNDEFFLKSKREGYRSRSSFKLIQINEKFKIFNKNTKNILDLGSAPGGWLQVVKKHSNSKCKILGVDILSIEKIENVSFLKVDVFEKNYNFGFSLGLMNKDVGLAMNIIKNPIMFSKINSLLKESLDKYGYDADYTEICKLYFES